MAHVKPTFWLPEEGLRERRRSIRQAFAEPAGGRADCGGGRVNPMLVVAEKCDRALVALSMRLRISPQARMRRETTVPKG
jgi:hypothetical protein